MYFRRIFILLLLSSVFVNCDRDDICTEDTPKTPLMIVKFFDAENPGTPKSVNNFSLVLDGEDYLLFDPVSTDSIGIPLQTFQDYTHYIFVNNYTDSLYNYDKIFFTYTRTDQYISRACGFRTNFSQLQAALQTPTEGSWIEFVEIISDSINIIRPNDTHLHIYH